MATEYLCDLVQRLPHFGHLEVGAFVLPPSVVLFEMRGSVVLIQWLRAVTVVAYIINSLPAFHEKGDDLLSLDSLCGVWIYST